MPTRRVAISKEVFDACIEVELDSDVSGLLMEELLSRSDTGPVVKVATETVRVTIEGPAWQRFVQTKEDRPVDMNPETIFAVKSTDYLAFPSQGWDTIDATLHFYNEKREELATACVDNRHGISIRSHETNQTYPVSFKCATILSKLVGCVENVSIREEECLAPIPKASLNSWQPTDRISSKWATIPEWMVSLSLRWASHHLRVHVLFSACVPLSTNQRGATPDIFFESATVEHTTLKERTSRRCTFRVHDSVGGCVCKNHGASQGKHWRTALQVNFCGCKCDRSMCPFHPKRVSSSTTDPIVEAICTHGLAVKLLCFHKEEDGKCTCSTLMNVPLPDDNFVSLFAASCVELTEKPQVVPTEQLKQALETMFEHSLREDIADFSASDVNIGLRDQMIESVLRSGDYFFGPPEGKRSGKSALRKRKKEAASKHDTEQASVPKWMCACMTTHSHLMPLH